MDEPFWILFQVPCPTPDGRSARDLYERRLTWISADMAADARAHGCSFHRAWYAADGSAFYAIAHWRSRADASAFFERWDIEAEPGEVGIPLVGDVGLAPLG
jgi:hypothetical protein